MIRERGTDQGHTVLIKKGSKKGLVRGHDLHVILNHEQHARIFRSLNLIADAIKQVVRNMIMIRR